MSRAELAAIGPSSSLRAIEPGSCACRQDVPFQCSMNPVQRTACTAPRQASVPLTAATGAGCLCVPARPHCPRQPPSGSCRGPGRTRVEHDHGQRRGRQHPAQYPHIRRLAARSWVVVTRARQIRAQGCRAYSRGGIGRLIARAQDPQPADPAGLGLVVRLLLDQVVAAGLAHAQAVGDVVAARHVARSSPSTAR